MTLNCPACKGVAIRRSHARREDGLLRALFFAGFRCRDCHARFFRLAPGPLVGAASALVFVGAIAFGWGMRSVYLDSLAEHEAATNAPTPASVDLIAADSPQAPLLSGTAGALAAAAERGDPKAQFLLGMAYRSGQLPANDPSVAYQWIARSAQQGYADAQYMLGSLHLAGHGVLQSFPTAFEWFERAAQQNHAGAQYSLALMYRRGYGVQANNAKAYVWFNLAAAQGHDRAREARDSLLPALTQEQVRTAQREAQEWRPEAPKYVQ